MYDLTAIGGKSGRESFEYFDSAAAAGRPHGPAVRGGKFLATELVLSLSLGPAVPLVLSQALRGGTGSGVGAAAVNLAENAVWFTLTSSSEHPIERQMRSVGPTSLAAPLRRTAAACGVVLAG